jgi:hypothetical protein
MYKTGASAWAWQQSLVPFKYTAAGFIETTNNTSGTVGGVAAWATGAHTSSGSNDYVNYFMFVGNLNGQESIVWIPGQVRHANTTAAYAEAWSSINLAGFPIKDGVAVWMFTYRLNGSQLGKVTLTRLPVRVSGNITTSTAQVSLIHDTLADVHLAASGVTYGHVNDTTQTIAGAKTFSSGLAFSGTAAADTLANLSAPGSDLLTLRNFILLGL